MNLCIYYIQKRSPSYIKVLNECEFSRLKPKGEQQIMARFRFNTAEQAINMVEHLDAGGWIVMPVEEGHGKYTFIDINRDDIHKIYRESKVVHLVTKSESEYDYGDM